MNIGRNSNISPKLRGIMESPLRTTYGARMAYYLSSADDYNKHRKRLNRQIRGIRKDLGIITSDTRNYKEKNKISKIEKVDYGADRRYGLIFLLTAERNLLHTFEIKALLEIGDDRATPYKSLMLSKMKKALALSRKLLDLMSEEEDNDLVTEVYIYAALAQGVFSINKRQWKKALTAFSVAKCALNFLYFQRHSDSTKDASEHISSDRTLMNELTDLLIDPSLNVALSHSNKEEFNSSDLNSVARRHCHDKNLAYLMPVIDMIAKEDASFVSDVTEYIDLTKSIQWRSYTAGIYNDELAFKLMKLKEQESKADCNEEEYFDGLISGWTEVLDLHMEDTQKNKEEEEFERSQDRAILSTYINYNLLFTRIKRDSNMAEDLMRKVSADYNGNNKLSSYDVLSRLLETVVATISEVIELPGVYNDDDLVDSLESLRKFYTCKKSYNLSRAFVSVQRFPEALKILLHTAQVVNNEIHYKVKNFPYNVSSENDVEAFRSILQDEVLKLRILAQFSVESSNDSFNEHFAIENVDKFNNKALNQLMGLNKVPSLVSVACKPVLFDIGYNYISYGTRSLQRAEVPQAVDEEATKKKGGAFFGIFGRT